jgi:hypothetical protein
MSDTRILQLKIMTGVLKRVGKEKLSYRKDTDGKDQTLYQEEKEFR